MTPSQAIVSVLQVADVTGKIGGKLSLCMNHISTLESISNTDNQRTAVQQLKAHLENIILFHKTVRKYAAQNVASV